MGSSILSLFSPIIDDEFEGRAMGSAIEAIVVVAGLVVLLVVASTVGKIISVVFVVVVTSPVGLVISVVVVVVVASPVVVVGSPVKVLLLGS
jgi:hypothetical protein